MAISLKGVIHGKTIELEQAVNLPDGKEVTVVVQPSEAGEKLPAGEGLRRAFWFALQFGCESLSA